MELWLSSCEVRGVGHSALAQDWLDDRGRRGLIHPDPTCGDAVNVTKSIDLQVFCESRGKSLRITQF